MVEVVEAIGDAVIQGVEAAGQFVESGGPVAVAAAQTVAQIAFSVGLQELSKPGNPHSVAGETPTKQTQPPRIDVGGKARVAGFFMLRESSTNLFQVTAVCRGPIDGFERYYLFDDQISFSDTRIGALGFAYPSPGAVLKLADGTYGIKTWLFSRLGLPTETSYLSDKDFSELGANTWTTAHRGDLTASLFLYLEPVEQKDFATVFGKGIAVASAVAVGVFYDWRDTGQALDDWTTWKPSTNPVVVLAHYETGYVNWNDSGSIADKVAAFAAKITPFIGDWIQAADDCDEAVETVNSSALLTALVDAHHTVAPFDSVAGIVAGTSVNLGGAAETLTVDSVSGLNVTFTTQTQFKHDQGTPVSWRVDPSVTVTEPRYQVNAWWLTSTPPAKVRAGLLDTFDGRRFESVNGAVRIQAGKYREPLIVLTEANLKGYTWTRGVPDESAVNQLAFTYLEPNLKYTTVPGDPWRDEDDITARGEEKSAAPELSWCPTHAQGRRLCKRKMSRLLADGRGTLDVDFFGLQVLFGSGLNADALPCFRYLKVQIADEIDSLADIVVEILDADIDWDKLSVTFQVVVADPEIDAWDAALEEGTPPMIATSVQGSVAPIPNIVSITPFLDGSSGTRLKILLTDPANSSLAYASAWRVAGATSWNEKDYANVTPSGGLVELDTDFVTAGATLEVEAAFVSPTGAQSWSGIWTIVATAGATAPGPPTITSQSGGSGIYTINWTDGAETDFFAAAVFQGTDTTFADAVNVTGPMTAAPSASQSYSPTGLAAGTYHLWVVAQNTAGLTSTPAGPVSVTVTGSGGGFGGGFGGGGSLPP